jgi:hypothetical protein
MPSMIGDQPRSRAASLQNTSADARPMIVSGYLARPAEPLAQGQLRPGSVSYLAIRFRARGGLRYLSVDLSHAFRVAGSQVRLHGTSDYLLAKRIQETPNFGLSLWTWTGYDCTSGTQPPQRSIS